MAIESPSQSPSPSPSQAARLLSRTNAVKTTTGLAPGYLQANLVILPSRYSSAFQDLCARNPVPCPLLGLTPVGNPQKILPEGCIKHDDFDIRTDFPSYVVHAEDGKSVRVKTDILDEWTSDHVGFLIGCSFSFEDALTRNGLRICHQLAGNVVAMYQSTIPVLPAGVFWGSSMVVSMRTYLPSEIERVRDITRPFLATHGEPVAWGWEGAKSIGVRDIHNPDFGDAQEFKEGEVPVFWVCRSPHYHNVACGVTPQVAVRHAVRAGRVQGVTMAHEPGHMLVTDWTVEDLPRIPGRIAELGRV
ncbi:uncharacterized protein DSM5745_10391 [Aspergillus mulundensis]|uniref:DUF1445 domain protein n=1 Tax=Aspergillus mulundensis TaxID=1810919 RepID=A0A3D8QIW3_9EURO|nr:Uncharacterized protein DSM5745_10391 [Aspergillus mulundensis]RDW61719.1 Uncharacterized protein DSM5745_10391 [Aspergillus mulundensis]